MHRLRSNVYVGQPGEAVGLSTAVHRGGQIVVTLDGEALSGGSFTLPATAGHQVNLQIALAGPRGASCVVGISTVDNVDGGTDGDLLLCQPLTPAPVHRYSFSVASAAAVVSLGGLRTRERPAVVGPAPRSRRRARTVPPSSTKRVRRARRRKR
ncbi:MAG: hypothetical protein ABI051_13620 [Vicinamibacterales bacterium]